MDEQIATLGGLLGKVDVEKKRLLPSGLKPGDTFTYISSQVPDKVKRAAFVGFVKGRTHTGEKELAIRYQEALLLEGELSHRSLESLSSASLKDDKGQDTWFSLKVRTVRPNGEEFMDSGWRFDRRSRKDSNNIILEKEGNKLKKTVSEADLIAWNTPTLRD